MCIQCILCYLYCNHKIASVLSITSILAIFFECNKTCWLPISQECAVQEVATQSRRQPRPGDQRGDQREGGAAHPVHPLLPRPLPTHQPQAQGCSPQVTQVYKQHNLLIFRHLLTSTALIDMIFFTHMPIILPLIVPREKLSRKSSGVLSINPYFFHDFFFCL